MTKFCVQCGVQFWTRKSQQKLCGVECQHAYARTQDNGGRFKKGTTPPNKTPVGAVKIRHRHNRPDGPRAWVKVAEPSTWKLRAVVVWESVNGPVPKGFVVHHLNHNQLDDRIENLQALTRAEHLAEHRDEFDHQARLERSRATRRAKREMAQAEASGSE